MTVRPYFLLLFVSFAAAAGTAGEPRPSPAPDDGRQSARDDARRKIDATKLQYGGPDSNPTHDENPFGPLNRKLRGNNKLYNGPEGVGTVAPTNSSLCPTCSLPLYRHSEPGFECLPANPPLDSKGRPMELVKIKTRSARCPVCLAGFEAALPGHINDRAGLDRDFCAHAVGKYAVYSRVWMCPDCGYSAFINGFDKALDGKPLDEESKKFVREKFPELTQKRMLEVAGLLKKEGQEFPPELLKFSKYVEQTGIPDWMKYDNAIKIYERVRPPHVLMAALYLDAAHACRREICNEVSVPGLSEDMQVSIGKSIVRMNDLINTEAVRIRRMRGVRIIDPTYTETEAAVIVEACTGIVQQSEQSGASLEEAGETPVKSPKSYFTTGDMYFLYIRYAGALDRMGRTIDAAKALEKAITFLPEKFSVSFSDKDKKPIQAKKGVPEQFEDFYAKQMTHLRRVATERLERLKMEREFLFNCCRERLAAIKFKNEITFRDVTKVLADENPDEWDPAVTAYLNGELLRRAGDNDGAAAWFRAANAITNKALAAVESAEKEAPAGDAKIQEKIAAARDRLGSVRAWTAEQMSMINKPGIPDDYVKGVISQMLTAMGISEKDVGDVPAPAVALPKTVVEPAEAPKAPVPNAASAIKTREELYKMYYAALLKYRDAKKENPASLLELGKTGFVKPEDAFLDEKGKLFCPETRERIGYGKNWEPGDKNATIFFPIKAGTKSLYADGSVR